MKCSKCLSEWSLKEKLPESLIKCPNCGEQITFDFDVSDARKLLKYIVVNAGSNFLLDKRGSCYVIEEIYKNAKGKNTLLQVLREDSIKDLFTANINSRDIVKASVVQYIKTDLRLSDEWANRVINDIVYALGWSEEDTTIIMSNGYEALDKGDFSDAVYCFKKASDYGDIDGLIMLGLCYEFGLGVDVDEIKAFDLYAQAEKKDSSCHHFEDIAYNNNFAYKGQALKEIAIRWYEKAAYCGSITGKSRLGATYANECVSDPSFAEKAIRCLEEVANDDDGTSSCNLGVIYGFRQYGIMDMDKAEYWLKISIEKGNLLAYCNLATLYFLLNRFDDSFSLLQEAYNKGMLRAAYLSGSFYSKIGDLDDAFKWHKIAADKGYKESESIVGTLFLTGNKAVKPNHEMAIKYLTSAADKGCAEALHNFGVIFESGYGTEVDLHKAYDYYIDAARHGYTNSKIKLATLLLIENKRGQLNIDDDEIVEWMLGLAKQGNEHGMYYIGLMLINGICLEKDVKNGISWLTEAAEKGLVFSQTAVADMYYSGEIVDKNYHKALYWHEKAAESNVSESMIRLAVMYSQGLGTDKDLNRAIHYLKRVEAIYNDYSSQSQINDINHNRAIYSDSAIEHMKLAKEYREELENELKKSSGLFSRLFGKKK